MIDKREYNKDPNTAALKGRGFINQRSTLTLPSWARRIPRFRFGNFIPTVNLLDIAYPCIGRLGLIFYKVVVVVNSPAQKSFRFGNLIPTVNLLDIAYRFIGRLGLIFSKGGCSKFPRPKVREHGSWHLK